jgi:SAM-dependent methyltransferase
VTDIYDEIYAATYDAVYGEKNYAGECEAVGKLIARFGDGKIRSLLDLGCGTGRHAVLLAGRGFDVTGVDRSEAMLARAQQRAREAGASVEFRHGDIRSYSSGRRFDAVLMNFNVIGYMSSNDDLVGALKTARDNVRTGGLFIADFWYGPAVVADPPGHNTREYDTADGHIVRSSTGQHLPHEQASVITIRIKRTKDGQVVDESEEIHRVRYFFPLELELALRFSGFRLLGFTGFPAVDTGVSNEKWVAALVAAAV